MNRKYYEAYDDRYRQIHSMDLQWFCNAPSSIVLDTVKKLGLTAQQPILELGCGEGRDAIALLEEGYALLATDISPEAIGYCRRRFAPYRDHFAVADCVAGQLDEKFDFIYAVAVVHMLVEDADRSSFYRFIRNHLVPGGHALICTMGDGTEERRSNPATAFQLQNRIHEQSGTPVCIASTSCRMVNFDTFQKELSANGLVILEQGITAVEPDFPQMMYALCRAEQKEELV